MHALSLKSKSLFGSRLANFPTNFRTIDFTSCVRLHTVGIIIQVPRVDEYSVVDVEFSGDKGRLGSDDIMRVIQWVFFRRLPPSVRILKLTLHGILPLKPSLEQTSGVRFWEILGASLDAFEKVEIITLKALSGATPCTESKQEYLKACFPRLAQRGAIAFPDDTFSHHSGRSILDLFTCG